MLAIGGLKSIASGSALAGQDVYADRIILPNSSLRILANAFSVNTGIGFDAANGSVVFYSSGTEIFKTWGGGGSFNAGTATSYCYSSAIASGSVGFQLNTAGARLKFSSGGTNDYLLSDGASEISTPGKIKAGGSLGGSATALEVHNATSDSFTIVDRFRSLSFISGDLFYGLTSSLTMLFRSVRTDAAAAVGHTFAVAADYTTSGAKIASFQDNYDATPSEKLYIDKDGVLAAQMGTSATLKPVPSVANVNTTAVGNVGASGPDDLITYSLPANSLSANGKGVRVKCWGTTANNANAKTVQFAFGAVTLAKQLTVSIAGKWSFDALIIRTGSNTQDVFIDACNYGGTTVSSTDGATVQRLSSFGAGAETDSGAITIKCQSTTTTADNDIVQEGMLVEFIN